MPVLDTEVLFALDPTDKKHGRALTLLASVPDLAVPDTSLLEFQMVLRTMGRRAAEIRQAVLNVGTILEGHGVSEARTMGVLLIASQCELESKYGLTFFDSLIAASALSVDLTIVSDDPAFDAVPGLKRIPLR